MNTEQILSVIKGKAYRLNDNNLWTAWHPVTNMNEDEYHGPIYKGPKIHHLNWAKLLAWMYSVNARLGVECQARLYAERLGDNPSIIAVPFPQEYSKMSPMTTKEIPSGKLYEELSAKYPPKSHIYIGSVHTHCNSSAFQSGTDHNDEKDDKGLHITLGRMNDKKRFDMDVRLTYLGDSFIPVMSSWYYHPVLDKLNEAEMPDDQVNDFICMLMASNPGPGIEYPKEWDDVMVERKTQFVPYNGTNNGAWGFQRTDNTTSANHSNLPKFPGQNMNTGKDTRNKNNKKNKGQHQYNFGDIDDDWPGPQIESDNWDHRDLDISMLDEHEVGKIIGEYVAELVGILIYARTPGPLEHSVFMDVINEYVFEGLNLLSEKDIHIIANKISAETIINPDEAMDKLESMLEVAAEQCEKALHEAEAKAEAAAVNNKHKGGAA